MTRLVWDVGALLVALDDPTRPQALWDAALRTVARDPGPVDEVLVVDSPTGAALWDAETLGAPRPLLLAGDVAALLGAVAADDPRTWAGVLEGRYAAGSLGSYVVARATRGLEHVGLAPAAPAAPVAPASSAASSSPAGGPVLGPDVPDDVLPEVVPPGRVGTTDPACCAGLRVPLSLVLPG